MSYASKDFDLDVLTRVAEGKQVVRYAPDLGLFGTWTGPGVTSLHFYDQRGTEVDVTIADTELGDDEAATAILGYFEHVRREAGGTGDLPPLVLYAIAGDSRMVTTLTTCNGCEMRPMAPGQTAPGSRGLCAECLSEVDADS